LRGAALATALAFAALIVVVLLLADSSVHPFGPHYLACAERGRALRAAFVGENVVAGNPTGGRVAGRAGVGVGARFRGRGATRAR
jgi:hypothetical protein